MGAAPIGAPGCPELAFWTASIESVRIVLIARVSSSGAIARLGRAETPTAHSLCRGWRRRSRPVAAAAELYQRAPARALRPSGVAAGLARAGRIVGVAPGSRPYHPQPG